MKWLNVTFIPLLLPENVFLEKKTRISHRGLLLLIGKNY